MLFDNNIIHWILGGLLAWWCVRWNIFVCLFLWPLVCFPIETSLPTARLDCFFSFNTPQGMKHDSSMGKKHAKHTKRMLGWGPWCRSVFASKTTDNISHGPWSWHILSKPSRRHKICMRYALISWKNKQKLKKSQSLIFDIVFAVLKQWTLQFNYNKFVK